MNVLIISQCDKRALIETRRILDQFAERRGDRTWQTPITQEGLDTLRRLLRKTARKNTAVACHWIRRLDHSELIWVVGDRRRFNAEGAAPTKTTQRNILRQEDENGWHTGELIRLLADLSGLLHDLGKAIEAFQQRLTGALKGRNLIRHEWVSLRLFEAFVGRDDDMTWLARLAAPTAEDDALWEGRLHKDGRDGPCDSPFKTLSNAPLAQALGWLVVTHHRLPVLPRGAMFQLPMLRGLLSQMQPAWNEQAFDEADSSALESYWSFPMGLPVTTDAWRQRASRLARRLAKFAALQAGGGSAHAVLNNPFVMHLSRLSLMLADHHYSSLENSEADLAQRVKLIPGNKLLANTRRIDSAPNQPLDEHLLGVAQHGAEVARFLPRFGKYLPGLGSHKRLKQRATDERFRWQDKSAEVASGMRMRSQQQGAFVVNMASTGCGKTLANARVMYALADPAVGMRCAFAMGLRTLTLQTGKAFRAMLALGDDDLAVRVGGSASRTLFEHYEQQAEATGSSSSQKLLEEDSHVSYEGNIDTHPLLRRAVADPEVRKLLVAPLLVCTIDHLTPATESQRGGRQIAPMLRLMSSDLVLDEPDDFDLADLPALTRLVHWAGLLGARVLLSSATLPPALVQGLFDAYRNGRQHFNRNCSLRANLDDAPPTICCAWIDEFHQEAQDCPDADNFGLAHAQFSQRRHRELTQLAKTPRRSAELLPVQGMKVIKPIELPQLAEIFAAQVLSASVRLHFTHSSTDPVSKKQVSFGLIRMANIEPLFEVALALFRQPVPEGVRVHLCVYHSRHPLLVRSAIERQLDQALQRHDPEAVYALPDIRRRLNASPEHHHIFMVLGSPVTEVGRDHDYDWAVVEPSSIRSIIQLAGRVRRHRPGIVDSPNILIFNKNLRCFTHPTQPAYCKPGFETDTFRLSSHDLQQLMLPEEIAVIDARPRIVSPVPSALRPHERMVDLEHSRMRIEMLQQQAAAPTSVGSRARSVDTQTALPILRLNSTTWWQQAPQDALLSGVLQYEQPFRKESFPKDVTLVFLPDEDGYTAVLHRVIEALPGRKTLYEPSDLRCKRLADDLVSSRQMEPWGVTDYMTALAELAAALDLSLAVCAQRFGTVTVRSNDNGWRFHPALGFAQRR